MLSLLPLKKILVRVALMALLIPATAGAIELRDAELVAGGNPVLQNGAGTVQLENARLGRVGPTVFVPEPGGLWQLGSAIGFLALLSMSRRRRPALPDTTHSSPLIKKG